MQKYQKFLFGKLKVNNSLKPGQKITKTDIVQWWWTREAVTLSGQEGLEIRFRDAQNDFGGAK